MILALLCNSRIHVSWSFHPISRTVFPYREWMLLLVLVGIAVASLDDCAWVGWNGTMNCCQTLLCTLWIIIGSFSSVSSTLHKCNNFWPFHLYVNSCWIRKVRLLPVFCLVSYLLNLRTHFLQYWYFLLFWHYSLLYSQLYLFIPKILACQRNLFSCWTSFLSFKRFISLHLCFSHSFCQFIQ